MIQDDHIFYDTIFCNKNINITLFENIEEKQRLRAVA